MATTPTSRFQLDARSFQSWLNNLIEQQDDPRVGSGREGSEDKGTLSATNGSKGASLSKLGATFIPVVVYVAVCIIIFVIARRRLHRVYAPRTISALRAPEVAATRLPDGWFNWIKPFFQIPDTVVLNHGSFDGFFFLRYLKVLRNICFVGCAIAWPILFPLHATGGNGQQELELLTIGNVKNPTRLYANALVAWLLFGFVLFTVARESIYYLNMRQAYLSSPYYAQRLSSRTVLFSNVPARYLDEQRLRKLYGDAVKRVWLPRTSKHLVNLVKEREQTAMRLEKAEIELIKKANRVRNKQLRKQYKAEKKQKKSQGADEEQAMSRVESSAAAGDDTPVSSPEGSPAALAEEEKPRGPMDSPATTAVPSTFGGLTAVPSTVDGHNPGEGDTASTESDDEYKHPYGVNAPINDVRGSVAAMYIPAQQRPSHKPLANYFRSQDTIKWTRQRLKQLNKDIAQIRKRLKSPNCKTGDLLGAAFIEFDSQEAAQAAHQILAHHQPLHMAPRLLGIRPDEVVWDALRMKWWERIIRRFGILGLIVAGIVFWSIPSAIVGVVSNIQALTKMFPWLGWLNDLPRPILGFLTGFVPAIALSIFMALVPVMLRACARTAGVPTHNMVELFTQTAYFAFQVVQVFLITTLTSAASSAFFEILVDPISAKDVLASNLPLASNFYISYILIQCLANAGTEILRPFDLLKHAILGRLAQHPRTHFRLWHTMRPTRWGRDFPVFSNLGVIALAYACIAPLILIFAAMGMWFTYTIWRYNLLFVLDTDMDSKGLFYPRALMHLTVGLYLAEICLIGMFFLNGAIGPGVLVVFLLVFTGLVHFSIANAIYPLLQNLPQTLRLEEEFQEDEKIKEEAERARQNDPDAATNGAASSYFDEEQTFGDEDDDLSTHSDDEIPDPIGNRGIEGSATVRDTVRDTVVPWLKGWVKSAAKEEADSMGIDISSKPKEGPNFVERWLNPHVHEDFIAIRKNLMTLPEELPEYDNDPRRNYNPPEVWTPKPILWIPRDEARVSRQEVAHTRAMTTHISDKGAVLDDNGLVKVQVEEAPFLRQRLIL